MNNKIIIAVIVVVIIIGGWYGLSGGASSAGATISADGSLLGSTTVTENQDSEVLKILLDMRTIKLDDSIFQNPAFNVLKDTSQQIIPEAVGRSNPFAPVGSDQDGAEGIQQDSLQRQSPSSLIE